MAKNGQAKVLSNDELSAVLDEIEHYRYPAKNALIIQISFKQGLRAQEMALLRVREIAALSDEFACVYKVKDVLVLPKSFTIGASDEASEQAHPGCQAGHPVVPDSSHGHRHSKE